MEIFTLLETLEDILEKGKSVPFTSKTVVDKEELLDIVKEIRLKLPEELKPPILPLMFMLFAPVPFTFRVVS